MIQREKKVRQAWRPAGPKRRVQMRAPSVRHFRAAGKPETLSAIIEAGAAGATAGEIAEAVGCSPDDAADLLGELVAVGLAVVVQRPDGTAYAARRAEVTS